MTFKPELVRGMIIAGAVGDALGANIEFDTAATIAKDHTRAEMATQYPKGSYPAGSITDDTQITLFGIEAMIKVRTKKTSIVDEFPEAYLRWYTTQRGAPAGVGLVARPEMHHSRAPGATCMSSLSHPSGIGSLHKRPNDSKGCGTVMRAAPCAVNTEPAYCAAVSAAVTHTHPTGVAAAAAQATLLHQLILGVPLNAAVASTLNELDFATAEDPGPIKLGLPDWVRPGLVDVDAIITHALYLAGTEDGRTHAEVIDGEWGSSGHGGGWTADECLGIALYAALVNPGDPMAALIDSVWHSGDSDSTGAVAGNILGAAYGTGWIPKPLLEGLVEHRVVFEYANLLAANYC